MSPTFKRTAKRVTKQCSACGMSNDCIEVEALLAGGASGAPRSKVVLCAECRKALEEEAARKA